MVGSAVGAGLYRLAGDGKPDQRATVPAAAAAVSRHVPAGAKRTNVVDDRAVEKDGLQFRLVYDVAGRSIPLMVEIHTHDAQQAKYWQDCDSQEAPAAECGMQALGGGGKLMTMRDPETRQGVAIAWRRDAVVIASIDLTAEEVIGPEVLSAIATDRMVGLTTSAKMLERGKKIELTSMDEYLANLPARGQR
ncbi:hypothetical protein ACQPXM_13635 [Kribbella sp. CA-253562]|uniref:hypothetical protein n=1 Tax=Kribbella sp. CA-253562 TaxID=3239942 RepID=UPI003D91FF2D